MRPDNEDLFLHSCRFCTCDQHFHHHHNLLSTTNPFSDHPIRGVRSAIYFSRSSDVLLSALACSFTGSLIPTFATFSEVASLSSTRFSNSLEWSLPTLPVSKNRKTCNYALFSLHSVTRLGSAMRAPQVSHQVASILASLAWSLCLFAFSHALSFPLPETTSFSP